MSIVQIVSGLLGSFSVLLSCGLPIILAFIGWSIGTTVERRHNRWLNEMEARLLTMPITDLKSPPTSIHASGAVMVAGSVVLSADHFRKLLATLRKLIGGEIAIYQRLLTRARREAVCRMMSEAHRVGAVAVINIRLETSTIGDPNGKKGAVAEVIAYGTAVLPDETRLATHSG